MRRGAKPAKAKVGTKRSVARKSLKTEGSRVLDLKTRLAGPLVQQTAMSEIRFVEGAPVRARGKPGPAEPRAYVLHPGTAGIQPPKDIEGLRTKVVRRLPPPPIEPETPIAPRELKAQLTVAKPLAMTSADRDRLRELNAALPRRRRGAGLQTAAEDCGCHQVIGTVVPGTPLQPMDTVGTWVSMPIFEHGIDGFSGFLFTTFSNIAAQSFEFLGAYSTGNKAELSVFDWSCVDGKEGIPLWHRLLGGRCPSLAPYVPVMAPTDGATAAGGC